MHTFKALIISRPLALHPFFPFTMFPSSPPSSSSIGSAPPSSSSILQWLPISPLGSGSFGHVFLALNLDDSSLFAAKSAPSSSSPALLALHNEFHILQSLHSPFILRFLGANFANCPHSAQPILHNIFLEYMDGGSLVDLLRKSGGKLRDENLVKHYTRAILQGLDYLHQKGIVHCDIKSHNILIGSSGIKIADFGAARKLGEASALDGTLRGTPLWMAPEVIEGEEPGKPSDIWSLGCTVVEMLQGWPPWGHINNLAALFFEVASSKKNPPLPESISPEARDFLLKCLDRDPKARPEAAELLQHPFLRGWEYESKGNQVSPRSTLDLWHSEGESSDWEVETMVGSGPILPFPARRRAVMVSSRIVDEGSEWVTVRQAEGWVEKKKVPFMQAAAAAGEALPVRTACDVSLECAEFLKSRKAKVQ